MYKKELCILMYKYHNGLFPSVFDYLFTHLGSSHSYDTRNADNYRFEIHKMRNAISDGPKIWNNIPNEFFKTANTSINLKRKCVNICRTKSVAFII